MPTDDTPSKTTEILNEIASKSELTETDTEALSEKINQDMTAHFRD